MSRIISLTPTAPMRVAAPVVKLIWKICVGPPESELNEANAAPLSDEMSKPTDAIRIECRRPVNRR